jgi:hypothetical protein
MPLNTTEEAQTRTESMTQSSIRLRKSIFVLVGVSLIIASIAFRQYELTFFQTASLELGIVFLAVMLVDQLWQWCGGKPVEHQVSILSEQIGRLSKAVDVIEGSRHIGLEAVYDRLGNFGTQASWLRLVEGARGHVDLMGRTMFGWTNSEKLVELIVDKIVRDDVTFRWLVMHKDNKYLPLLVEEDKNIGSMLSGKLEHVYQTLRNIRAELPPDRKRNLQVKLYRHVPLYCSILRIDDRYYVNQYLFSASSENSPLFCVEDGGVWSTTYSQEFATIWKTSEGLFPTQE